MKWQSSIVLFWRKRTAMAIFCILFPFPSSVCCGPHPMSHVVVSFISCFFCCLRPGYTIACLHLDYVNWCESTTDRFSLQLYGENTVKWDSSAPFGSLLKSSRLFWLACLDQKYIQLANIQQRRAWALGQIQVSGDKENNPGWVGESQRRDRND